MVFGIIHEQSMEFANHIFNNNLTNSNIYAFENRIEICGFTHIETHVLNPLNTVNV